jgi:hypothetical protein
LFGQFNRRPKSDVVDFSIAGSFEASTGDRERLLSSRQVLDIGACMSGRPIGVVFLRTAESKQAQTDEHLATLSADQLLRLLWKIEAVIQSKAAESS